MRGYKCWVYVLKVVSADSFYVGFTGNLEERLDAHRKGRGHRATSSGHLELVEVVECDSDTAREIERTKTLEYVEKYGKDRVVGHMFSFKKRSKPKEREERASVREVHSIIHHGEEDGEYFRVCRECIHFDNPGHICTLLDEPTLGPYSCVFWSSGLWGESYDAIEKNATKMAESWFTLACADIIRALFEKGCPMYKIHERAFPELSQQKPYTAYRTQKVLANDFVLRNLGISKSEDEWTEFDRLQEEVKGRVGYGGCSEL
jgi:predicted GIY-YIG superfamily endonuclease